MTVLESAQVLRDQATQYLTAGRLDEAEVILMKLLEAGQFLDATHNHLGVIAFRRDRFAEAARHFEREIELRPESAGAYANRASCAVHLDRPEEAIFYADKALAIDGSEPTAPTIRGAALTTLLRHEEALPDLFSGVMRHPDDLSALVTLARTLREVGRLEEALIWYDRALIVDPANIEANFSRGLAYLQLGDFERGWPGYEWRWYKDELRNHLAKLDKPRWVGQLDLAGGTILLREEQGLGDTIQFARYARLLAANGTKVVLQLRPELRDLFACFEDTLTVIGHSDPLPPYNCHAPLMSLPLIFGTRIDTIPAAPRYLAAPADRLAYWNKHLGPRRRPRIGIVWSGQPKHTNDRARSIQLADFPVPNPELFDVFSLQQVVRDADQPTLDALGITHFGSQLRDLADTAAIVEQLDLVIAVDTSVAHLAAALGRPVWLLLSFNADWRWLPGRDDSPWYPTIRIFKQTRIGDWKGVYDRVTAALAQAAGIAHAA